VLPLSAGVKAEKSDYFCFFPHASWLSYSYVQKFSFMIDGHDFVAIAATKFGSK